MGNVPFAACWDRLDRADKHRYSLVEVWNEYIDTSPFDFTFEHQGDGVHILQACQSRPIPVAFALELGEWLYNLRACLDYTVWAACAHVTGRLPPPDEGILQFPAYDTPKAWNNNIHRLKHLDEPHRDMLLKMQPFNNTSGASVIAVINELARIDRHRRLTISTTYLAEMEPVVSVPQGCEVKLQWGQRLLINGRADLARITISPWRDGFAAEINPRVGIDPEVAEWPNLPFWKTIRLTDRLMMAQSFVESVVAAFEYDCTGASRRADLLAEDYKNECARREYLKEPVTPTPTSPFGILRSGPFRARWRDSMASLFHGVPVLLRADTVADVIQLGTSNKIRKRQPPSLTHPRRSGLAGSFIRDRGVILQRAPDAVR
ncbi:hypothetical protein [Fodinicola feengrottensis]|uniref:hypothetical protein n=1 Tax=Fodinicola feengrottensis TaxID=435914 RepID=UPI0013D84B7D|nr:hypothetical protein [Fodinicola feengrottensis]